MTFKFLNNGLYYQGNSISNTENIAIGCYMIFFGDRKIYILITEIDLSTKTFCRRKIKEMY